MSDPVSLLKSLVSIPSVNPMGRDLTGDIYLEGRMTDFLESFFQKHGIACSREKVEENRENIYAILPGAKEGLIVLEAHQDTVPIDGMIIDPFDPVEKDGRIYGRGSCDIKGGMSCMLAALIKLKTLPAETRPTIAMTCTVNEEYGYSGATALANHWTSLPENSIFPKKPDAVIVAEPTDLHVVIAHKGALRWNLTTKGKACHSSNPDLGENAIYRMSSVCLALDRYHREVLSQREEHPLVGRPTLSVGVIQGGISVNTVPDRCTIEIDRRLLPNENSDLALTDLIQYLEQSDELDFPIEHEVVRINAGGLDNSSENEELADKILLTANKYASQRKSVGVPYGTDASQFSVIGIPTVVFGPGSIDQAHTRDEWLDIEELQKATEILVDLLSNW